MGYISKATNYAKRQLQMLAMPGELENFEGLTLGIFALQVLQSPLHPGELSGIAHR